MSKKTLFLAICCISSSFLSTAQAADTNAKPKRPLPSVVVQTVDTKNVSPEIKQSGRVEAIQTVDLRARVEGFLLKRNFVEGTMVKEGDVLFNIEKDTYQIALKEREADLMSAKATLKNNAADLERKKDMLKKDLISQSDVDAAEAARDTATAQVKLSQAALEQAKLNLSYTDVVSPIDGVIGIANYTKGNLVKTTSDPLATITSVDPIYVSVEIGEKKLLQTRNLQMQNGDENLKAVPTLVLSDGTTYNHKGEFTYMGPEVDMTSNTVKVRATFPNPEHTLRPGQYVTVSIGLNKQNILPVVPQESVQKDKKGYFVLVVDADSKIEERRVDVGRQIDGDWAIKSGLKKGEQVVVQGLQKVRPDMKVNVVEAKGATK